MDFSGIVCCAVVCRREILYSIAGMREGRKTERKRGDMKRRREERKRHIEKSGRGKEGTLRETPGRGKE